MDARSRALDAAILRFIRTYPEGPAPEPAFEALAMRLFEHQFRSNPFYRRLCGRRGARPGNVRGWRELPAMPTAGFKELVLASFPARRALKVFRTSGTTQGARGAHFFDTLRLYEASLEAAFRAYVLPDRARLSMRFLVPTPRRAPDSSLSHMAGRVARIGRGASRWYLRRSGPAFAALERDLRAARGPVLLFTTAFALAGFLDRLGARRLALPPGSRVMETGGFKGRAREVPKARLYARASRALGVAPTHLVSEYGMTELSSQFYDTALRDALERRRRRPMKAGPAWARALVVDPATGREAAAGRTGLLRVVDLANRGSVLAVDTEDLGRAVKDGFELLGRASGAELRGCSLAYEELVAS